MPDRQRIRADAKDSSRSDSSLPSGRPLAEESPACVAAIPQGDDLRAMISETAYFLALERGFAPGSELDDWLTAEALVHERLSSNR